MVWKTQLYLVSDDIYENNIALVPSSLPIHVDVIQINSKPSSFSANT